MAKFLKFIKVKKKFVSLSLCVKLIKILDPNSS